jgi:hypothetical protein
MKTVTVDANALQQVLQALNGPSHLIRELISIRNLPGHDCPITRLIEEYNAAVRDYEQQKTSEPQNNQSDWLLVVYGDVDPSLQGPYTDRDEVLRMARAHRIEEDTDKENGLYHIHVDDNGLPHVGSFGGGEMEDISDE